MDNVVGHPYHMMGTELGASVTRATALLSHQRLSSLVGKFEIQVHWVHLELISL